MKSKLIIIVTLALLFTIAIGVLPFFNSESSTEPVYFAKVIFGKELTQKNTYHFMAQGRDIFLDKNGDHVPQKNEKVNGAENMVIGDGSERFDITLVDLGVSPELISESRPQKLILYVDSVGDHRFQMTGQLEMTTHVDSDHYLHFGGPLRFLAMEPISLRPTTKSKQDLKIYLGTMVHNKSSATLVAPNKKPPFPIAKVRFDDKPDTDINLVMDYFC